MKHLICIVCPNGCHLDVDDENGFKVTGNRCQRGAEYGKTELTNPTRVLTSTVKISSASHRRCPVKTDGPIPKGKLFEAMDVLDNVELKSPVKRGDVVINNILGTGANLIVTKDM